QDSIKQPAAPGDPNDFYKFSLASSAKFSAVMIGASSATAALFLIKDVNGNGVIDSGDVLASSMNANTANQSISKSLVAGTYFLRVRGDKGHTNYALTLKTV